MYTTSFIKPTSLQRIHRPHKVGYVRMAVDSETQKLLDMAAKARAEAASLEAELAKTRPARPPVNAAPVAKTETKPAAPARIVTPPPPKVTMSSSDLVQKMSDLSFDSADSAKKALDSLREKGLCTRWNSASLGEVWPVSQGQLKSQTGIDGTSLNVEQNLDDLKYALGAVVVFSAVMAVATNLIIGGNAGAASTYIFAILPILFLGVGSTSPGIIVAIVSILKERLDPSYSERRVNHEAAHFLAGYLCGMPIKGYTLTGATTSVDFFETNDGDQSTIGRKLNRPEIDSISVVAMAGAVREVQKYGNAAGSAADLDTLGRLMNRVEPPMRNQAQEEQTRWAALTAARLLKEHSKELEAVSTAFAEKKSVAECIAAIETC